MFRGYSTKSCRTNCECFFLVVRISAIRFQSPVLLGLHGEGRLISCARKEKFEHVAISRLPGRWGSLDFNKTVLLFRLLKWKMHGPGDYIYIYISSCLARTRPNTLASTAQAGHVRIRTLSRAPGHAGHVWTRTSTRKKARIDAK